MDIGKITLAVKQWTDERDMFAAAIRCATSPEQLEQIIIDTRWAERRKRAAEQLYKAIPQEVIDNE